MAETPALGSRRKASSWGPRLLHHLRVRPRLATATAVGILAWVVLPPNLAGTSRALVAWDLGVGLYLVLAATQMLDGNVEKMRQRARLQDDGAGVILGSTVAAAVVSLAAIVLELVGVKSLSPHRQTLHLVLAGVTIFVSWCFVHTSFALHYAHEFYADRRQGEKACLEFPGGGLPDYLDFLYFAFVIGMTSQTSDVAIGSRALRRLALLHGIIAFLFNTTLVALGVNIAAGLI